jgi:hypothetical protein
VVVTVREGSLFQAFDPRRGITKEGGKGREGGKEGRREGVERKRVKGVRENRKKTVKDGRQET